MGLTLENAVSLNVRFLNGQSATFYLLPTNCLHMAETLAQACEWVSLYANDDYDSSWFHDCLDGAPL